MSRVPIRVRLTLAFALVVAALLAGVGAFLYVRLDDDLTASLDGVLRSRAQDLVDALGRGDAIAGAGSGRLVERGETYAQLLSPAGRVLDASAGAGADPTLTPGELNAARRAALVLDRGPLPGLDEPSRLLATPVGDAGRVLVVGATLGDRDEGLASLRQELLIGGPIALLLVSLAGYALSGAALRPVERMRDRAAAISAARPHERLPVPSAGDEIARLGATLNAMLDRLETALVHERRLVADAGHELRTPLALLRAELELATREGANRAELQAAVRSAAEESERLSQLAEDLLLLAQADHGEHPTERTNAVVCVVVDQVLRRFTPRAEALGRKLGAEGGTDERVRADPLQLEQALGNMVDNALRHGEGPVLLLVAVRDGRVEICVRDAGPGVPAAFLPRAFERFSRADVARGRGGAGLGLAIVETVARTAGGEARLENRCEGGLEAALILPIAPAPALTSLKFPNES